MNKTGGKEIKISKRSEGSSGTRKRVKPKSEKFASAGIKAEDDADADISDDCNAEDNESVLFKGSSYEGDIRMGIVEIMEEETDGEDPEDENEEYRLQVQ